MGSWFRPEWRLCGRLPMHPWPRVGLAHGIGGVPDRGARVALPGSSGATAEGPEGLGGGILLDFLRGSVRQGNQLDKGESNEHYCPIVDAGRRSRA